MSWNSDQVKQENKHNGSKLYDKYLKDEENGRRHSLTEMYEHSACYYLCLTPKYKKVKRFTCDNCCVRDKRHWSDEEACPDYFKAEVIKKYNIALMRKQNMGCIRGRPWSDDYDISDKLFVEIFKVKDGEYWIRYNKEAHMLWQSAYTSSGDRGSRPVFTGSQGR